MALTLCTTILRDGSLRDVTVEFTAELAVPASRACWDEPGFAAEYDCTLVTAELICPEVDDHPLTEAEMQTVQTWFECNHDKASDAANDNDVGAL